MLHRNLRRAASVVVMIGFGVAMLGSAAAAPVHHRHHYHRYGVGPGPAIGAMIGTFIGAAATAVAMSDDGYYGPGPYGYAPAPYYAPPPYYGPPPFYQPW
jgi:hypothetical protein